MLFSIAYEKVMLAFIPGIIAEAQVAPDDMLEQAHSLRLHKLIDHVAQDSANGEEALVGVTDVREPCLVKQNLLHDEDGDSFGELRACLHDAKAEGYNFRGKQEMDHGVVVILLQS